MGKSDRATMVGFLALVFWSMMFGFVRLTSQGFGVLLGGALIYTLGAISLFIVLRPSAPSAYPLKYFLVSGGLFVFYEAAISASIGLAVSSTQTVELSMVNYLWPSLTVLLNSTAMRGTCGLACALPGAAVATVGVMLALGGDAGLDAGVVAADISSNPLPFTLTLAAALAWAAYSVVTPRITNGKDATAYFMIGVAAVFWAMFAMSGAPAPESAPSIGSILALLAAMGSIAAGYACWNHGLLFGNVSRMALASYAAPFLSVTAKLDYLRARAAWAFLGGRCVRRCRVAVEPAHGQAHGEPRKSLARKEDSGRLSIEAAFSSCPQRWRPLLRCRAHFFCVLTARFLTVCPL